MKKIKAGKSPLANLTPSNKITLIAAVLVAIPAFTVAFFTYDQAQITKRENETTSVVNYVPEDLNVNDAQQAISCWGSIASLRTDAYRCSDLNSYLYDPCFLVKLESGPKRSYFYCPVNLENAEGDRSLYLKTLDINEEFANSRDDLKGDSEVDLPWLIVLSDNSECRRITGALNPTYDNKSIFYSCVNGKYTVATDRVIKGKKHFFQCKLKNQPVFEQCFVKIEVH